MARIVVGLSGGVDSSVAALLLKQQGHEVIGLFMRNWNDAAVTLEDECPWIDDSRDAMLVAEQIGIPFQIIDLSQEYKSRIVDYMFAEYEAGRTPNPDVLCNREIKFDVFLKNALKLGAEYVATGHYARREEIDVNGQKIYRLLSGLDKSKDQSYFLCQLSQDQLSKALFPIGHLQKSEVRRIAQDAGLVTGAKKDSQGLCFVGKVSLPEFLQQKLAIKTGNVVLIDEDSDALLEHKLNLTNPEAGPENWAKRPVFSEANGKVMGTHQGAHFFTIGQRKGLQIGGTGLPMFVLQTDVDNNIVFTGLGDKHIGLQMKALELVAPGLHMVRNDLTLLDLCTRKLKARVRYRQPLFDCHLFVTETRHFCVFDLAQSSVTPGQFLAVYDGEELICSGTIQ
jgi:tRNA-specific 2-thiouridylase